MVALDVSSADFIQKRAYLNLAASGLGIGTLLVLSFFFLKTIPRFLELQAREESEKHLATLGKMSTALAHEIRNPLGAMKGLTQVVQETLSRDHCSQKMLTTVIDEAERLEHLVDDLLLFAGTKKPNFFEFDLIKLIGDVKSMLQVRLDEEEIFLAIPDPGTPLLVVTDENGLKQVLYNIVLNAVDVSPKGGTIRVKATTSAKKSITVTIADEGPGFGCKDPEEFFQPFLTTKFKGTGLGLAISRQIVDRIGGTLHLENGKNGGARCTIKVPLDHVLNRRNPAVGDNLHAKPKSLTQTTINSHG